MSNFSGINNFGSLTTSNGQKLTFKDFDKNDDGKITEEEYNQVLKDIKLDSVDLSTVDKNGDKEITDDEFKIWEQKQQMQQAVNNLAQEIAIDFAGDKSNYIPELTSALKDLIDSYANDYTGAISEMATMFEKDLPEKYAKISADILANDPSTIAANTLNELITNLTKSKETLPESILKALSTQLDTAAQNFIKSYKGNNLEADLKVYLNEWLTKTDKEKLNGDVVTYQKRLEKFGSTVESSELPSLQECAKQLLTAALNNGIEVQLGSQKVTLSNISAVLKKYTDGESLKADMQTFINGLNTVNKLDSIKETEARKAFTDIKGSEYTIDSNLIDFSGIDGYFDNSQIHERGKGWSGSRDKAYSKGVELLNNETLKSQMKSQIEKMLQEKGVPFDKIADIFENIYDQSAIETLNTEGIITGRGARGLSSKGHAYINIKNCVDTFITTFNKNIEEAINELNKSNSDFDTIDLDMSVLGRDEDGKKIETANNDDILNSYKTGKPLTTRKHGADYYVKIAEQIINGLKSQMLGKAQVMCKANGVEFDIGAFNTMFNNIKSIAVNTAVTGTGANGRSSQGVAGSVVGGAGAGAAAMGAAGLVGAEAAGVTLGATTLTGALAEVTAFASGPVGWVIGGVTAALAGFGLIGFGHHSSSTLDTRKLVDGFTQMFKVSYSDWVDSEKAKEANK